ncbi:TetR/AcrR family transcriptional regulator [Aciditerrimonas ferrireducens]|jgi:AcrR family transcriptional regulator|uniref:TetR/AcrR family transcriptional regulator n=1 Tax=Aciditerrimonas ferrireducens TaxID=667306 RepID=A0ABV6BZ02_9ACTN|nr:TetR/AcrR family transcriptional regulator [Aciditerrimonas ferrireducens]MCK4176876.1 TetR/AcrR family transcriptional regulator [Aciditerrimonas ferrireducens]
MGRAEETRERILRAAEDVVLDEGVAALTLERAAAAAGVSKGGVLYHFPTRDALVTAMVARLTERFEEQLRRHGANGPGPGSFTLAYLRCEATPTTDPEDERVDRLGAALLAALAADPSLLAPLAEAYERWQRRCELDGLPPVTATLVRLAADGLWLTELLGLGVLSAERRRSVVEELERLVAAGTEASGPGAGTRARRSRPGARRGGGR